MRLAKTALVFAAIEIFATGNAIADGEKSTSVKTVVVADYRVTESQQCIRDNAPRVEAAISDLTQATKFLVENVCADSVAKENSERMAKQTDAAAAKWQKMCDDQKVAQKPTRSKESGSLNFDACSMARVTQRVGIVNTNADEDDSDDNYMYVGLGSPADVALASNLLLDLRLSHSKSGTSH